MLRLALVSALALVAAAPQATGGPAENEAACAGIREADAQLLFAFAARDPARFTRLIADDAVFLGTSVAHGKNAVIESWAQIASDVRNSLLWAPREVRCSGDLGYSLGEYELRRTSARGTVTSSYGTYLTIWRRGADGSWQAVVNAGSPPRPRE